MLVTGILHSDGWSVGCWTPVNSALFGQKKFHGDYFLFSPASPMVKVFMEAESLVEVHQITLEKEDGPATDLRRWGRLNLSIGPEKLCTWNLPKFAESLNGCRACQPPEIQNVPKPSMMPRVRTRFTVLPTRAKRLLWSLREDSRWAQSGKTILLHDGRQPLGGRLRGVYLILPWRIGSHQKLITFRAIISR